LSLTNQLPASVVERLGEGRAVYGEVALNDEFSLPRSAFRIEAAKNSALFIHHWIRKSNPARGNAGARQFE